MRIPEFVDNMAKRFDSKLSAQDQALAFLEDCKIHLKKYEGEVLGYAFHEIVAINKSRTHPTVAKIRKICSDKMGKTHKDNNPMSKDRAEWIANTKIFNEYKSTDRFKWACQNMIGWDVELFMSRKGVAPEREDIQWMMKAHEEFKKNQAYMEHDMDISSSRLAIYKMGNALNEKNLKYYHAHTD